MQTMESVENENYKAPLPAEDGTSAAKEKLVTADATKITFSKADGKDQNGDAKIDIEGVQSPFVGLSKEELMKYANDPFWVRMRMALLVLFWLLWLAMLVGAIAIIVITPRCAPPPQLAWWQSSPVYHVEVAAFKDSNGDGRGDFLGLASKLDYIKSLGMSTVLLSNIFPTSGDGGILDFTKVNEAELGSEEDFLALVNATQERGMHLVLEMLPGFTDLQHPWFADSAAQKEGFGDLYVWANGSQDTPDAPPNDWVMSNGIPAWSYNAERASFYLHRRGPHSPDLNLHSPHVQEKLHEVLRFWLDKGVSGFLVANLTGGADGLEDKSGYLPDVLHLLKDWRELLGNYSATHETSHRLLAVEFSGSAVDAAKLQGSSEEPAADLVLNGAFVEQETAPTATSLQQLVKGTLDVVTPKGHWSSLVLGRGGLPRLVSRVGDELLDGLHMVAALLQGTPVFYYGDELGLGKEGSSAQSMMPWKSEETANTATADGSHAAVADIGGNMTVSHVDVVRSAVALREKIAVRLGTTVTSVLGNGTVFVMLRVRKGTPGYMVVFNTHSEAVTVNLAEASSHVPESGHVEVVSGGSGLSKESKVKLGDFPLNPQEAVVLQFVPIFQ